MEKISISQTLFFPTTVQAQYKINDTLSQKNLFLTTLIKSAKHQIFDLLIPEKNESQINYLKRCFREYCLSLSEELVIGLTNGKNILNAIESLEFESEEYDRIFENVYVLQVSTKQERTLWLYNFLYDSKLEMLHPLYATSLIHHFYMASIHSISHYNGKIAFEIANIIWWYDDPSYFINELYKEIAKYYKTEKPSQKQIDDYTNEQGILTPMKFIEYIGKNSLVETDLLSLDKLEELSINCVHHEKLNIIIQNIKVIYKLDEMLHHIGQKNNVLLRMLNNFYFQFFQNPFYIFEYGQKEFNKYGQQKIGLIQETLEDLRNNQELYDESATFSLILNSEESYEQAKIALNLLNQEVEAILTVGNLLENWE